jgi:internalin A
MLLLVSGSMRSIHVGDWSLVKMAVDARYAGTRDLSGRFLTVVPPDLVQLTNLQELDLSHNQLTILPPEIAQLTNLQELDLSHNQLTILPPEIAQLTNLQKLDLSHNQLTILPPELAQLLSYRLVLYLSGNPLFDPLPELIGRGFDALAAYLSSLDDVVAQFEAKVLLVGEGNVGKTSLVASLLGAPFVVNRETTHGIEIHPLILRHPSLDVDMTIWTWDSGGQEVYRITHQFFSVVVPCISWCGTRVRVRNRTRLKGGCVVSGFVSARSAGQLW